MNRSESRITPITRLEGVCCHRSPWVLVTPSRILENGWVLSRDGIIQAVGTGDPPHPARDLGEGVLMPGLVNAHVHLELTALQGLVRTGRGFGAWVRDLIAKREAAGEDRLFRAAFGGAAGLVRSGTLVAAEVSTLGITRDAVNQAGLAGVWFREYLGGPLSGIERPEEGGPDMAVSVAGHAPHTTDPIFLRKLKALTRRCRIPFSIHLAESADETEFITRAKGPWADFLAERGIDTASWPVPAPSPVEYLHRLGILDAGTLAVHLLCIDNRDRDLLRRTNAWPVLCPRSNKALHERLPDLPGLVAAGFRPALGTDSAASTPTLDLFDEMAFTARHFPGIEPGVILAMATVNGAAALGLEAVAGTLEPGKRAWMIHVESAAHNPDSLLETLIHDR